MTLYFGHPEVDFLYRHTRDGRRFGFNRIAGRGRAAAAADIVAVRDTLRSGLRGIGVS